MKRTSAEEAGIVVERLDALSRTRALTDQESATLERAIRIQDGRDGGFFGATKEMARLGVKRDLSKYANKKRNETVPHTTATPGRERLRSTR